MASPPDGPLPNSSIDGGFTLLEVLIAITILLIVSIGFVPLMTTSLSMALKAKQQSVMVNAANSYIEQARFMPYASLGVVGGNPSGTLAAVTVQSVGNFQVSLQPTVTWFDDPNISGANNMKKLDLAVTCTNFAGQVTASYIAEVYIGPHADASGTTTGTSLPSIAFDAQSPTDGGVVWGNSVHVGATAGAADANSSLSLLRLYVDGVLLESNVGAPAQWSVGGQSDTESFSWDSTARDSGGNLISSDGHHTLVAEAWDTDGQHSLAQRTVVIANASPSTPTSLTATVGPLSSGSLSLVAATTWGTSYDGVDPASSYTLSIWPQPVSATANSMASWTAQPHATTDTALTVGLSPLSRYVLGATALGPVRGSLGSLASTTTLSVPAVTPPEFTAATYQNTWSDKKLTMKASLTLGAPTFPYIAVSNTLVRYNYPAMLVSATLASSSSFTFTDTPISGVTVQNSGKLPQYCYRVIIVITPAGYPGNAPQVTVSSPLMGPNLYSPDSGNLVFQSW